MFKLFDPNQKGPYFSSVLVLTGFFCLFFGGAFPDARGFDGRSLPPGFPPFLAAGALKVLMITFKRVDLPLTCANVRKLCAAK